MTSCPGATLEAHMTSGDLKRRIDNTLAGGFSLTPVSAQEGQTIAAAITAGNR